MGLTKIGALWEKDGAKGTYMSGEIEIPKGTEGKLRVLVFRNTNKERDKEPDHRIMVSDGEDDRAPRKTKRDEEPAERYSPPITDDEPPF